MISFRTRVGGRRWTNPVENLDAGSVGGVTTAAPLAAAVHDARAAATADAALAGEKPVEDQ